jgi:hypothetical protein
MASYSTPGVYVEEVQTLPPSVAEVATAVPAFIGYTERGPGPDTGVKTVTKRIGSMLEFMTEFGQAYPVKFSVPNPADPVVSRTPNQPNFALYYALNHYFKNGGGPCYVVSVGNYKATPVLANFSEGIKALEQEDEPTLIVLTDAACLLSPADYYQLCGEALQQCKGLGDRFTILDVVPSEKGAESNEKDWQAFRDKSPSNNLDYGAAYTPYLQTSLNYFYSEDEVAITGTATGATATSSQEWSKTFSSNLVVKYSGSGLLNSPAVKIVGDATASQITFKTDTTKEKLIISGVAITGKTAADVDSAWKGLSATEKQSLPAGYSVESTGDVNGTVNNTATTTGGTPVFVDLEKTNATTSQNVTLASSQNVTLASLAGTQAEQYNKIKLLLNEQRIVLPPSAAMAGIYARVDREQGIWKAPANEGVIAVLSPVVKITDKQQEQLNIDAKVGKSINAIRAFTGRGTVVWGARTLAGNDNEWRYISVRRLFITIEESAKKASAFAVFEPNNQSTWLKVRAMIESYLYSLWQEGALAGATAEEAYYVSVGLGVTMTSDDVFNGKMIVQIGIAAVRPAEFIVLRFSHKLQTA